LLSKVLVELDDLLGKATILLQCSAKLRGLEGLTLEHARGFSGAQLSEEVSGEHLALGCWDLLHLLQTRKRFEFAYALFDQQLGSEVGRNSAYFLEDLL
jgi:hypothetical protein